MPIGWTIEPQKGNRVRFRTIYVRDVLAYKKQRDGKRRRILDDLSRAEAEEGFTTGNRRIVTQTNAFIVVLDTCVLAPMPLWDTVLLLAEHPAFYIPRWSAGMESNAA